MQRLIAPLAALVLAACFGGGSSSGPPAKLRFASEPSNARAGEPFSFRVVIEDSFGNATTKSTTAVSVTLADAMGAPVQLSGTTSIEATNGLAVFTDLRIAATGKFVLTANAEGLKAATSAQFEVLPAGAARLVFLTQPGSVQTGAATSVSVGIQDALGHQVSDAAAQVTLSLIGAAQLSGTTMANTNQGVASFTDLRVSPGGTGFRLIASADGVASAMSDAFDVTSPGAAAKLAFTSEPQDGVLGQTLSPAITVAVQDAVGVAVPTASPMVTLSLVGRGTLSGVTTVPAENGVATFDNVTVDAPGTNYRLVAIADGLQNGTSAAFSIIAPGQATKLAFTVNPTNVAAGSPISITVQAQDSAGLLVATASTAVKISVSGGATLLGTTIAATTAGTATFSDLHVDRPATALFFTASADGLSPATSALFDVTAGMPNKLAFVVQPSAVRVGALVQPYPAVEVQDALGNRVASASNQVTMALLQGLGPNAALAGTLLRGPAAGVATFDDLSVDHGGILLRLKASSSGLTPATSDPFTVLAAPEGLVATDATLTTHVALSWNSVLGALAYKVYRGNPPAGALLGTVSGTTFNVLDAASPAALGPPLNVLATKGTSADFVRVTWADPAPNDGPAESYYVVASEGAVDSLESDVVSGRLAAPPIVGFTVSYTSPSGPTGSIDVGVEHAFDDIAAPVGEITPGTATASKRQSAAAVHLAISGESVVPATVTYQVRARTAGGVGGVAGATGHRALGPFEYHWELWRDLNDPTPQDLPGATWTTFDDISAPPNGIVRYYRARLSAAGAETKWTNLAAGSKIAPFGLNDELWTTNGNAAAVWANASTVFVGGSFTRVMPVTGSFAAIDQTSGTATYTWLRPNGQVLAIAPDNVGGYYIGGSFTQVAGVPRQNMAHINAAGDLDLTFDPSPDGAVRAIAVLGSVVYVGGLFNNIGGAVRSRLAALNSDDGLATSWDPQVAGTVVNAIAIGNSTVYIGGIFGVVGGTGRYNLAALDVTGNPTSFQANATVSSGTSGEVRALALNGNTLYLAGNFGYINYPSTNRDGIAAVNATSGAPTAFVASSNPPVNALVVNGNTVYVGGDSQVGSRNYLAALNATSGADTGWAPVPNGPVNALAVSGTQVYAGGEFTTIGGATRERLAALNGAPGATGGAFAWDPGPNGEVDALVIAGNRVYVGGLFSGAGGIRRDYLAAMDRVGGTAVTGFNAGVTGGTITGIAGLTGSIYITGTFTNVGGQARSYAASVDSTTGAIRPWAPGFNGVVNGITAGGGSIYAVGSFTAPRANTAALDANGGLLAWNPNINAPSQVNAVHYTASAVYVGGYWSYIGACCSTYRPSIAAFDPTSGAVSAYSASTSYAVSAIAAGASTVHFGYNNTYNLQSTNLSGVGLSSPNIDVYPTRAIAVVGNVFYAGGAFTTVASTPRSHIAAMNVTSGALDTWDPGADADVYGMYSDGTTLYVVGNFDTIGSNPRRGLAAFTP